VSSIFARLQAATCILSDWLIHSDQLIDEVFDTLLVVLEIGAIAAVEVLCEHLLEVLMHLFSSLIFTEMLLVVLDQLLNLVLKLLLSETSLEMAATRSHDWLSDTFLRSWNCSWLRSCVGFDVWDLIS
jgi:hypothetical protein